MMQKSVVEEMLLTAKAYSDAELDTPATERRANGEVVPIPKSPVLLITARLLAPLVRKMMPFAALAVDSISRPVS
jgi:hypothetical protein